MGCDIHCYGEVFENGKWNKVGNVFPYWYKEGEFIDHPYDNRNYDVFAILAGVRNGRGFAGIKIGEPITPISEPRDLPSNVSKEIKDISDEWDCDGHSHSYLILEEIANYDWNSSKISTGVIHIYDYKIYKETNKLNCGVSAGISGPKIRTISNSDADGILNGSIAFDKDIEYYTQINWVNTKKEVAELFLNNMEFFRGLYPNIDSTQIRIVFFFDN